MFSQAANEMWAHLAKDPQTSRKLFPTCLGNVTPIQTAGSLHNVFIFFLILSHFLKRWMELEGCCNSSSFHIFLFAHGYGMFGMGL